jgi:hypothetical protein
MPLYSQKKQREAALRPAPVTTPDLFVPDTAPAVPALPALGIDIAKATFRACLLRPGAQRSVEADFANTSEGFAALTRWLEEHGAPRTRAALEATGHYSLELLRYLHDARHAVSLLNPRWIKDYARSEGRRNKTDAVDARLIARYVQTHATRTWQHRTAAQDALQALSRRREEALRALTSEKLRLQSAAPQTASFIKTSIAHYERTAPLMRMQSMARTASSLSIVRTLTWSSRATSSRVLRRGCGCGDEVAGSVVMILE